ncbi:MAG: magnesium transporter, partial [Acidobacteriota bacterium]
PGGLTGRVDEAFGYRAAAASAAAVLVERMLFVGLTTLVAGHYVVAFSEAVFGVPSLAGRATTEAVASVVAVAVLCVLWLRTRVDRPLSATMLARWMWMPLMVPVVATIVGAMVVAFHARSLPILQALLPTFTAPGDARPFEPRHLLYLLAGVAIGLGYALPGIGSGFGLTRLAGELPQPRLRGLKRTLLLSTIYSLTVVVVAGLVYTVVVPDAVRSQWANAPLAGLVRHLPIPGGWRDLLVTTLAAAALLMLGYAAETGLIDSSTTLQRLARQGVLSDALLSPHRKFGTPTRVTDIAAIVTVVVLFVSGGHVEWLARAYAVGATWTLLFGIASFVRLRRRKPAHPPAPLAAPTAPTGPVRTTEGILFAAIIGVAGVAMLLVGDGATFAATGAIMVLSLLFVAAAPERSARPDVEDGDAFRLLPSTDLSLDRVDARPGNVLVGVRHPYALGHLTTALQHAGERDVVVMTARLIGRGSHHDNEEDSHQPTADERFLFSQVTALAERHNHAVRLLVVPAHDPFEAMIAAVLRLRSSEVYVGESISLSADDQARQLGEAWERADKPEQLRVRLVIHHRSGRTHTYVLGAHAPTLAEYDLELIHQLWLDATKTVGPHVHHHDIVRAALTQMAQQLNSSQRDDAMDAIRQVAQPAEEIAAVVRSRDFSRLRDTMRNRSPRDVAEVLSKLAIEDQVVAFRVLPRKDAAAAFEYLSQESQEALLKAMAQEEIAALLNDMAPDDRTMFLEELPAAATRQLLALLTPEERAVASTLLGYPEGSIGRLMTPHYVAVREEWTVQQVLDYVREHGQDSETLNVIYVADEQDRLIDDLRIRELLLASPSRLVADLLDRRFVALKATDDQEAAVAVFRQNDRVALPVTDTSGTLIGIVTIDDVLHVAEAVATKEIQRFGGSEAFDEPYMRIGFRRMIRKRAGWLTALFLGEMLTATAMGAFEKDIAKAVVLALFVPLIISSGG